MAETKLGLSIPGSTMKHSEFFVGANIQQFVAKYGAAITSRIKVHPSLTRLIGPHSIQIPSATFATAMVKGIFSQQAEPIKF